MKSFNYLNEIKIKSAIIFFGSFNPPTKGHQVLFDKIKFYIKLYNITDCKIYVDSVTNSDKPLTYDDKFPYIKKIIPDKYTLSTKQYDSLYDIINHELPHYDEIYIVANTNKILNYSKIENLSNKHNKLIKFLSSDYTSADTNSEFIINSKKTLKLIRQNKKGSAIMTLPNNLSDNDKENLYQIIKERLSDIDKIS